MKIITILNHKGGTGKSTTAQAMAQGLEAKGHKILVVDLDPQANTTLTLAGANPVAGTICDIYRLGKIKITPITDRMHLIAATQDLYNLEIKNLELLKKALALLDYDYIIIDTPPAIGPLTQSAILAANKIIVVAQAERYSFNGLGLIHKKIIELNQAYKMNQQIDGVLITRYTARLKLSKLMAEAMADLCGKYGTKIYRAKIRECSKIREIQAQGLNLFTGPTSNARTDYKNFIREALTT